MHTQLTYAELASLMERRAGVIVGPADLELQSDTPFADFGLDSLGLLGIVGALENEHGATIPADADACRTPRELLDVVNDVLRARA
ncbi:acyl carrier protein [Streptomyces sp. IBSBF 2435]|uniref:acyl carrier protein n=1 Tax=Streptomyces sp. IBSBF 2435 TaxID=2903531 RepID=UPI002FDBC9C0